jgi:endonuclease YncB( thermonuclease family)
MAEFKVTAIVDGDTFDVNPGWRWNGQSGTRIRPAGYDAPEMSTLAGQPAKNKLTSLLQDQMVGLGDAYRVDRGRLVCEVYLNGKNLTAYFPQFR